MFLGALYTYHEDACTVHFDEKIAEIEECIKIVSLDLNRRKLVRVGHFGEWALRYYFSIDEGGALHLFSEYAMDHRRLSDAFYQPELKFLILKTLMRTSRALKAAKKVYFGE